MKRKDCIHWIRSFAELIKEFMQENMCVRSIAIIQDTDHSKEPLQELIFHPNKKRPWQVIDYIDNDVVWLSDCQIDRYGYHIENVMVEFVNAYQDWVSHMHKEFHNMNDIIDKIKYEINQDGWRSKLNDVNETKSRLIQR